MQADLILYALVAAGLVFWLRSVLGTRSGDERERPNPFTTPVSEKTPIDTAVKDGAVTLPIAEIKPVLPRNVTITSEAVERVLADIVRQEPEFDVGKFAQGAQDAFAVIVEAFAGAERDTLRNLLEPNVYNAFNLAIANREAAGETMSNEIHAVRKADILDAKIDGRAAYITIRFIADETCVMRNKEGTILMGDPDRITEMNDIWTFSKILRNKDPRWLLHETRDGDVKEEIKAVPDVF